MTVGMTMRTWLLATVTAIGIAAGVQTASAATAHDQGGPVTSFYGVNGGPIDPFYGSVNPFYGAVNQAYGHINPFWGDISSFWGNINPFYGVIRPFYGNIDPFWGAINPFNGNSLDARIYSYWNSAGPQWGDINSLWNQLQASNATDYSQLQSELNSFVANAAAFWGSGLQPIATQLEAKYAIDPNDAASLAATSPEVRAAFFR